MSEAVRSWEHFSSLEPASRNFAHCPLNNATSFDRRQIVQLFVEWMFDCLEERLKSHRRFGCSAVVWEALFVCGVGPKCFQYLKQECEKSIRTRPAWFS